MSISNKIKYRFNSTDKLISPKSCFISVIENLNLVNKPHYHKGEVKNKGDDAILTHSSYVSKKELFLSSKYQENDLNMSEQISPINKINIKNQSKKEQAHVFEIIHLLNDNFRIDNENNSELQTPKVSSNELKNIKSALKIEEINSSSKVDPQNEFSIIQNYKTFNFEQIKLCEENKISIIKANKEIREITKEISFNINKLSYLDKQILIRRKKNEEKYNLFDDISNIDDTSLKSKVIRRTSSASNRILSIKKNCIYKKNTNHISNLIENSNDKSKNKIDPSNYINMIICNDIPTPQQNLANKKPINKEILSFLYIKIEDALRLIDKIYEIDKLLYLKPSTSKFIKQDNLSMKIEKDSSHKLLHNIILEINRIIKQIDSFDIEILNLENDLDMKDSIIIIKNQVISMINDLNNTSSRLIQSNRSKKVSTDKKCNKTNNSCSSSLFFK